jgi:hypothetical protein
VLGHAEQTETAIRKASHQILVCKKYDKIVKLTEILTSITSKADSSKVLVFVKPDDIDDVHSYLSDKGYPVLKEEPENLPEMASRIWNGFIAKRVTQILITHSSSSMLQKRNG